MQHILSKVKKIFFSWHRLLVLSQHSRISSMQREMASKHEESGMAIQALIDDKAQLIKRARGMLHPFSRFAI